MKHTKEQIVEIAKSVMKSISWSYDTDKPITAIFESIEKQCEGYEELDRFEEFKKLLKPKWIVFFDFEPESEIYFNKMFLDIDDNTGEPVEISHKQAAFTFKRKDNKEWELVR